MFKFSFAIFLFIVTSSYSELNNSAPDKLSFNVSNQINSELISDTESDFDPKVAILNTNNQIANSTTIVDYTNHDLFVLLKSELLNIHPRAPPFLSA